MPIRHGLALWTADRARVISPPRSTRPHCALHMPGILPAARSAAYSLPMPAEIQFHAGNRANVSRGHSDRLTLVKSDARQ